MGDLTEIIRALTFHQTSKCVWWNVGNLTEILEVLFEIFDISADIGTHLLKYWNLTETIETLFEIFDILAGIEMCLLRSRKSNGNPLNSIWNLWPFIWHRHVPAEISEISEITEILPETVDISADIEMCLLRSWKSHWNHWGYIRNLWRCSRCLWCIC